MGRHKFNGDLINSRRNRFSKLAMDNPNLCMKQEINIVLEILL